MEFITADKQPNVGEALPDCYGIRYGRTLGIFQPLPRMDHYICVGDGYAKYQDDGSGYDPSWVFGDTWTKGRSLHTVQKQLHEELLKGQVNPAIMELYDQQRKQVADLDIPNPFAPALRKRTLDCDGDEVDVDRALNMDPECFERRLPAKERRTVSLVYPGVVHAGVSETDIVNKILLGCLLAESLEEQGYQTRIVYANSLNEDNGKCSNQKRLKAEMNLSTIRCNTWTEVKGYSEPLDVSRILCLASPGLLRYYGFFWIEQNLDCFNMKVPGGYGQAPYRPSRVELEQMQGDVCINLDEGSGRIDKGYQTYAGKINKFLDSGNPQV